MNIDFILEKIKELKEMNEMFQEKAKEIILLFQDERIKDLKELKEEYNLYPNLKKEEVIFAIDSYQNLDYSLKNILECSQLLTEMILYCDDMSKYIIRKDVEGINLTRDKIKQTRFQEV